MKGVWGRVLLIDVGKRKVEDFTLDEGFYEKHLGGRGISNYLMLKLTKPGYHPLSPEAPLIFSTGPLNLPGFPGGARGIVCGKSPLTGILYESTAGGALPWAIRGSGYDALVLTGMSQEWVVVVVDGGRVSFLDAKGLVGLGTGEVEGFLKEKLGPSFQVVSVGSAAEKGVFFSSLVHSYNRVFGRGGLGAVMASKRVKALCVRGRSFPGLHNLERYKELCRENKTILKEAPYGKRLRDLGTGSAMESMSKMGLIPTRYFQMTSFDGIGDISPKAFRSRGLMIGKKGCPSCPVKCIKVVEVPELGVESIWGGPEYETLVAFGSLVMNRDPKIISFLHKFCNYHGIDTITAGSVAAMLFEAYEMGVVKKGDVGFELKWGDGKALVELVKMIVGGKGIGKVLAKGSRFASKELGISDPAEVKGLEVPFQEPRGNVGMSISYATSFRGAVHTEGFRDTVHAGENSSPELGIVKAMDIREVKGKAGPVFVAENFRSFTNSLILCFFTVMHTGPIRNVNLILEAVEAVTGLSLTMEEALRVGERNYVMGRLFMIREGVLGGEDRLPERFFKPSLDGRFIDREAFYRELREYYRLRGYDEKGAPRMEKLKELSISGI